MKQFPVQIFYGYQSDKAFYLQHGVRHYKQYEMNRVHNGFLIVCTSTIAVNQIFGNNSLLTFPLINKTRRRG